MIVKKRGEKIKRENLRRREDKGGRGEEVKG